MDTKGSVGRMGGDEKGKKGHFDRPGEAHGDWEAGRVEAKRIRAWGSFGAIRVSLLGWIISSEGDKWSKPGKSYKSR